MKLTKERAIAEHRKMWLWISRQIMKDYLAITTSTYRTFCGFKEAKRMARMAYKIAMLEEKEQ